MPQQANPDQLRAILDPLPIAPEFKHTIWNQWTQAETPMQFRQSFDSLDIPGEVKHQLWNLKFGDGGVTSPMPQPGARVTRNLGQAVERQRSMLEGAASTLPIAGAMVASPLAAASGIGLLGSAALSGVAAGGGEAAQQLIQRGLDSPNAPKTSREAAMRIATQGAGQSLTELGVGALTKPLQFLLQGAAPRGGLDPLSKQVADINSRYGLRLTAPEVTKNLWGKVLQHVATAGIAGQPAGRLAQEEGSQAASRLLDQELSMLSGATTPQGTGQAIQATLDNNTGLVSSILGSNVRRTAGTLAEAPIGIAPLKQWATDELKNANIIPEFLNSGESGSGIAIAKSLGYKSAADARAGLGERVWTDLMNREAAAGVSGDSEVAKAATNVIGKPDPTLEGVLRDIVQMPDQVPFRVANKIKQDLFNLNPNLPSAFKEDAVAVSKTANSKLTGIIHDAVGNTPEGQSWMQASSAYRDARQLLSKSENAPYKGQLIQSLLSSSPSEVVGKIKTIDDVQAVKDAILKYGSIGAPQDAAAAQQTWGQFQRQYVQGLLKDPEAAGIGNDLVGLKRRMDTAGPQVLGEIFSNQPQVLKNLQAIAEAMSRVQRMGSVNVLGITIGTHAAARLALAGAGGLVGYQAGGGDWKTGVAGAAAFEAMPMLLSRIIYSKPLTDLFIRGALGMAANSTQSTVASLGRAGVAATPFMSSAIADVVRAFEIAKVTAPQQQRPPMRPQLQPQVSPAAQRP